MTRYGHLAGFALVGAAVPLFAAWLMAANPNCGPAAGAGTVTSTCYAWGYPRVWAWTALAGVAGLLAAGVGAVVPTRWVERAARGPVGGLLFDPSDRTLLVLGPFTAGVAVLAPPLFYGTLTSDPALWWLLALPYAPFLAATAGSLVAQTVVPGAAFTAALAVVTAVTALGQALWFAAIAAGVARVQVAASRRNSASE